MAGILRLVAALVTVQRDGSWIQPFIHLTITGQNLLSPVSIPQLTAVNVTCLLSSQKPEPSAMNVMRIFTSQQQVLIAADVILLLHGW